MGETILRKFSLPQSFISVAIVPVVLKHGEGTLQIMMVDCPKSFLQIRKVVEDKLKFQLRCRETII